MLKIDDLTLHYGHSQILHGISMQAKPGEITCVMGTNGVGKTSLMRAISGAHPRSGGTVSLDGGRLGILPAHALARQGVGYVPQGREIFPLLSVRENLETGFSCLPKADRQVPDEIFELFPVLRQMQSRRGGDLSGGQQQQLAIARALITRPRLLLLDEPTEGIQPNIVQQISDVIRHLRDTQDMIIVLVEQYFDVAYELADRVLVLRQGRVVLSGERGAFSREELISNVSV
ncbi:MAG: urea ABC transporter ATP-binding subunit UrtE [Rhodobacter sp.]|jgi:urea transport system ATP-binding protein|nr:urea ABC transporter ATP-binding subunit UrtE [Rhodobacter sp.]